MLERKASMLTLTMSFILCYATAQEKKISASEYIETYKDIAITEMNRSGIPASITLAQGLHESGIGNSVLATKANNHFGIKCGSKWTGKEFYRWDDDPQKSCFRVYKDAVSSYIDHTEFLVNGTRYAFLFSYDKTDYKSWAKGLKKAGYATDPKYPNKLIATIEKYNLAQYDINMEILALESTKTSDSEPIATFTIHRKRSFLFDEYAAGLFRKNHSTYAIAKDNESALAAANRFDIPYDRFLRFNDLKDGDLLIKNQFIYIQNKKSTYQGNEDFHVVENDQSMYEIAQYYGVKLHTLYKLNELTNGEEPQNGEYIYLKEKALKKPATRPFAHKDLEPAIVDVKTDIEEPKNHLPQLNTTKKSLDHDKIIYGSTTYKSSHNSTQLNDEYADYLEINYDKNDENEDFDQLNAQTETDNDVSVYEDKTIEIPSTTDNQTNVPRSVDQRTTTQVASTSITFDLGSSKNTEILDTETVSTKYHLIEPGETLYGIHRKYNVSIDAIKEMNLLEDNMIIPGEKLMIPN